MASESRGKSRPDPTDPPFPPQTAWSTVLAAEGREPMFKAFWHCTILSPPLSAQECAGRLGLKEKDVRNYVFRIRREFRDVLLRHIRDSVEREGEIDDEVDFLLGLFRR